MRAKHLFGIGLFWFASAFGQPAQVPIGSDAVWQPGMSFIQSIHERCPNMAFPMLGECFANDMAESGAPPAAVNFTHRIGNQGFLRDFRKAGRVDIAYAYYVFAANENQHMLLVNGTPPIIDVDDLNLLDQKQLMQNPVYLYLRQRYPKISLWPGDRSGTRYPLAYQQPDGGQRFIVNYRLQNFCHACAVVGSADFSFDFDPKGRFLGTRLVRVKAAAGKAG